MNISKKILAVLLSLVLAIGGTFFIPSSEIHAQTEETASENTGNNNAYPGSIEVNDYGNLVRVSTAKQLAAALSDKNVDTVIYRTKTYNKITIKADANAKNKKLILDTPNANVTNKAVFKSITIYSAKDYTEAAKSNTIYIINLSEIGSLTVAAKKNIKELNVALYTGTFDSMIYLRKGAKISKQNYAYTGGSAPVWSTYNKSKKEISLTFTDTTGITRNYILTLDKYGRTVKDVLESGNPDENCITTYTYDKNGNVIKAESKYGENDEAYYTYTYKNNLVQYFTVQSTDGTDYNCTYSYDKKNNITGTKFRGDKDLQPYDLELTYTYDKKGRIVTKTYTETGYSEESKYTYNSKGLVTKAEIIATNGDQEMTNVITYKYNKAGDMIRQKYQINDDYIIMKFTYNENGKFISSEVVESTGNFEAQS